MQLCGVVVAVVVMATVLLLTTATVEAGPAAGVVRRESEGITPPSEIIDSKPTTETSESIHEDVVADKEEKEEVEASGVATSSIVEQAAVTPTAAPATSAVSVPEKVPEDTKPEQPTKPGKEKDPDPPKGSVTFDQRQHGKFNIRADLENFMIILIPQSTQSPPLFNLGGGGGGGSTGGFGQLSGSSLLDLFTRRVKTTKRTQSRRKPSTKYKSQWRKKVKNQLRKDLEEQEEVEKESSVAEDEFINIKKVTQEVGGSEETKLANDHKIFETLKRPDDKYKMETLEKIQRQLEVLLERVKTREAVAAEGVQMDHFIEGRTPYRVDISSLHIEPETRVDLIPSKQKPVQFRQYREDPILEIGTHMPKFYPQHWTFPNDVSNQNLHQRNGGGPMMVAFRDARSLPQDDGNEFRSNSVLANAFDPSRSRLLASFNDNLNLNANEYLNEGFIDLTDTEHSFDSLNVDNVDKIDSPTAEFDQEWELKLVGAEEDCGPDRKRDSYGICQFIPN